ncbi:MAG TPA: DoxX family protein [Gemmatirosa sp.]
METSLLFTPSLDDAIAISAGLLVVRLIVGLLMAAHGAQKLFGWLGGHGLEATAGRFEQIGFRPGRVFATLAGGTELASGLLVALGLLGPVGPALMLLVMIVAAVSVHWKFGIFAASNGIELALLYATAAFGLAFTGPGVFALDTVFGIEAAWTWPLVLGALALGVVGGVATLSARRVAPAASGAPAAAHAA